MSVDVSVHGLERAEVHHSGQSHWVTLHSGEGEVTIFLRNSNATDVADKLMAAINEAVGYPPPAPPPVAYVRDEHDDEIPF